ncbi:MAG: hypothetical protein KDC48_07270, partial [Planctomycetes bacterium]|nr:hypothetical protein [Planctomycetota bacterium]
MPHATLSRLARLVLASLPLTTLTAQAREAFERFERQTQGTWIVRWNAATKTPAELYGSGAPLADWRENSLAEARRHAQLLFAQWPGLLGLGCSEFREEIGARLGRSWSLTFAQHFGGVPVLGARVDVRIHGNGRLVFLGSTAWPLPATFDVTPTIDEANAVRLGWAGARCAPNDVPQPGKHRAPRLVILTDAAARTADLAWEVPIAAVLADGSGPIGRAYVDAHSGAFLRYTNDKHECALCATGAGPHGDRPALPTPATYTVMGYAHDGMSPTATPNNVPLPGVRVDVPGVGTFFTDGNGQFTADLGAPAAITARLLGEHSALVTGSNAPTVPITLQPGVGATLQFASSGSSQNTLAHTTAYLWTWRVNEFLRGILGSSPQLAAADHVVPTVNINSTCNAYYAGNSINFYRAGGSCNNTASASVIAHEWGHGLDDQYGGISQTNGLSEGWGDIHSLYLLDDPVIGHGFFTSGGGIRNGNNTRQYPTGNEVHAMGESWMGFAWKLRQNLRASLGTTQALAISNDIVLGSIVANANDQQSAVREVFIAADDDGNLLNGVPHYTELVAACNAHSLPYPPITAGVLQHTSLATTTEIGTPRPVEVVATPTFGTWTQLRLHYDDGQARQRELVPTGATNGYRALLPGAAAGQTMRYHFEGQHSTGPTIRLPATGEFAYVTLGEERVYLEDFETGGPGWTHGASSGSDDWEIGAPAGLGGAGWSDPAAAYRGSRCAGTDLGLVGDGAYSPSSNMWLRSPPIDCTGHTGLRLRFRRWLTCDGSIADLLMIRCAGTVAWVNPFAPTLDNGWVVYEIPVPQADNQPAVVLEFSLSSDASFEYGGWNLDDIELYHLSGNVAPPVRLAVLPEQAQQGSPITIDVQTPGFRPFGLAFSEQQGPLLLPGLPPLAIGPNYIALFTVTDASGHYTSTFNAPTPASALGLQWHSQVL